MSSVYKEVPHMDEVFKWKLVWYGAIIFALVLLKIFS